MYTRVNTDNFLILTYIYFLFLFFSNFRPEDRNNMTVADTEQRAPIEFPNDEKPAVCTSFCQIIIF